MASSGRKAPPTHPTVWIGLGLAAVGLLIAVYAYSGTRVYDITFAIVAFLGAALALAGILLSAWGRSVMAARLQRSRRHLIQTDTMKLQEEMPAEGTPPTVARPQRSLRASTFMGLLPKRGREAPPPPPPPAPSSPPPPPPLAPREYERIERLLLQCPACTARFQAEGHRPFVATCPVCNHTETVSSA